jgi:RNA polymerase sigma factor (sigma-70 family)
MRSIESPVDRPLAPSQDDDADVLREVVDGDRAALERLYQRYERPLFRYLLSLTRERGLVEEILQDTFVAVWRSAGTYQARSAVRIWLFGIARRQAHNVLRRRRRDSIDLDGVEAAIDAGATPEGQALARERRADLAAAVASLPAVQRETLGLIFVEGLSYREAAEVLGVPEGTVKSRLNHARQALRARMLPKEE